MKRLMLLILTCVLLSTGAVLPTSVIGADIKEVVEIHLNIEAVPVYSIRVDGYMVAENHFQTRNELLGCRDCIQREKGWGTMIASYTEKIYYLSEYYSVIQTPIGPHYVLTGISCLREEAIGKSQPYTPADIVVLPLPPSGHLADWDIYPGGWIFHPETLSWTRTHYWRESVEFLATWTEREYAYLTSTYRSQIHGFSDGSYLLTNCVITCLPEIEARKYFQTLGVISTQYVVGYANLLYEDIDLSDPNCWHISRAKILTSRQGFEVDLSRPGYNISRHVGSPGYYWISGDWRQDKINTFSKTSSLHKVAGVLAIRKDTGEYISGIPPELLFLLDDPNVFLEIAEKTQWLGGWGFDPTSTPGRIILTRSRP